MSIEQIAGLTTLAASLAFLIARFFINREKRPKNEKHRKNALFSKLLTKTQGDTGKANRLIEFERRRNPKATETELTKSAIERLEWDMNK